MVQLLCWIGRSRFEVRIFTVHPTGCARPARGGSVRGYKSGWSPRPHARANPALCGYPCRSPANGSRTNAAASPHTTHQLSSQKIHYRHHPFCGAEVELVRALRRTGDEVVVVRVPQGFQIAVPRWMLDPIHCSRLSQEERPRVSLRALVELTALIDAQPLRSTAHPPQVGPSPQPGATDASDKKDRLSSNESGLPQEGPLGKVSPIQSSSLLRTGHANLASRVNASPTRGEQ